MGGKSGGGGDAGTQTIKTEPSDIVKPYMQQALKMAARRYNQVSDPRTNPVLAEQIARPPLVNDQFMSGGMPLMAPLALNRPPLVNHQPQGNTMLDMLIKR
jgi:hypothetical protein